MRIVAIVGRLLKNTEYQKKNWKWFAILAMLGCIVFVLAVFAGSAIAISRDKKGGDENNTVSSDGDSQQEEKDVADDEKGATHVTCEAFSEDTELNGEKRRGNMSLQPVMMIPKRKSGSLKVTLFR